MVNGFDDEAEGGACIINIFLHDLLHNRRLPGIVESSALKSANISASIGLSVDTDSINIRISLSFNLAFLKIESILAVFCFAVRIGKVFEFWGREFKVQQVISYPRSASVSNIEQSSPPGLQSHAN